MKQKVEPLITLFMEKRNIKKVMENKAAQEAGAADAALLQFRKLINLDEFANQFMGMGGLDLRAHLGNCSEDGFPAELDIEDLFALNNGLAALQSMAQTLRFEVKRGIDVVYDREHTPKHKIEQ